MSTSTYSSGDNGMFPINSSLPLADRADSQIKLKVTGLLARKKYYSVFSIMDNNTGAVVDNSITHFSK